MNENDLRIIMESQKVLIDAAIDQLKENLETFAIAEKSLEEAQAEITHWRSTAYRLQDELADMEKQRDRARDTAARYIEATMKHEDNMKTGTWCDCGC